MMNCDQTRLRLASYLDGESPEDEREKVEEHLRGCAACLGELEALRRTGRLVNAWRVEGADLWQSVADAMDGEPAAQTAVAGDQTAAMMALLQEMQRDIRDLRSEVADLRSELSGRIGSLSMRTRTPVDNSVRRLGEAMPPPQGITAGESEWGAAKVQDPAKLEYTRITSARNPWLPTWPIKLEEDDLWNCERS